MVRLVPGCFGLGPPASVERESPFFSLEREKMIDRPLVSVVIVNWNRRDDVLKSLHYLRCQRDTPHEVIVVDNGSSDGSVEWLSQLEGIKLIAVGSNVGPAQARNIGVEHASGEYILFLDSDAVLGKWGLDRLVALMDGDPSIGIAGCRIINSHTRKLDQWFYQHPATTHEHRMFDTYSFSAAGAIARPAALRDAGPFWDELFIYNEEVDLSIRVLRAGYRVIYYPGVRVYHTPSTQGRLGPPNYWRLQIRNWIWIYYRYYNTSFCIYSILTCSLTHIIKCMLNGHLNACLAGIRAGLAGTEIRRRYPDKLTTGEMRRLQSLRRRLRFRVGRCLRIPTGLISGLRRQGRDGSNGAARARSAADVSG
jgi:GT2 family glycosyltransferase